MKRKIIHISEKYIMHIVKVMIKYIYLGRSNNSYLSTRFRKIK